MKKIFFILVLLSVSACGTSQTNVDVLDFANVVSGTVEGMETWGTAWGPGAFESTGERIFFTTINQEDKFLAYKGGPESDMMVGGFLTCASCHGPDGQGASHIMYNYTMNAPDIRYAALQAEKKDNMEYNFEDLRMALTQGQRPDGSSLNHYMPRWHIDDADLADLLDYLKSLP